MMKDWTVDIREMFKSELKESDISNLLAEYEDKGCKITQLYCTDPQKEAIKGFSKKFTGDKRTKEAKEIQKYSGIILTVE